MTKSKDKLSVIRYILNNLELKDAPLSSGEEAYLAGALSRLTTKQLSVLLYRIRMLNE